MEVKISPIEVKGGIHKVLVFYTLNISFTYFPKFNHHEKLLLSDLEDIRVRNQYYVRSLNFGKYVNEMFEEQTSVCL